MVTQPSPSTHPPRLERDVDDRIVAGVCAGIGRYFGIDPTFVRIGAAVLMLLGGVGAVAYLTAWLIVPERGADEPLLHRGASVDASPWRVVGGAVLVGIAVLVLVGGVWPGDAGDIVGPLLLGLTGAVLLLLPSRRTADAAAPGAGAAPAAATPPAADPPVTPPTSSAPAATAPAAGPPAADPPVSTALVPAPTTAVGPAASTDRPAPPPPAEQPTARTRPLRGFTTQAYGGAPEAPTRVVPPPPPKRRRPGTPIAFGILLVGAAVVTALAAADIGLTWEAALAILVIVAGVALAGTALWGGSPALIVVGFLLAAVVAAPIAADLHLRGGVGDRTLRPATAAEVPRTYELAMGQVRLDLRRAARRPGAGPVKVNVGLGRLLVIVPANARVTVDAHVSVGNLEVFDRYADGTDLDKDVVFGPIGGPPLRLDLDVGAGSLEVRRGDPPWSTPRGGSTSEDLTGAVPTPTTDRSLRATA